MTLLSLPPWRWVSRIVRHVFSNSPLNHVKWHTTRTALLKFENIRLIHLCGNYIILPMLQGVLASGVECIRLRLLPCVASDYGGVPTGRLQFCARNNVPSLEHRVSCSHCLWEIRQRKDLGLGREVCDYSKYLEIELPFVRYRTQARYEIIFLVNSSKNTAMFKIKLIIIITK